MTQQQKQNGAARRIYHVSSKAGEEWLIRAVSQAQAIRCASEGVYKAEVASPDTCIELASAGKKVIDATTEQKSDSE